MMPSDDLPADQVAEVLSPVETAPSLTERVYRVLKAYILDQRLKPGHKLSVPRLAQELAVSRTPVKEAVERLAQEGLVTALPNRGAYVTIMRPEDVEEIYQMREMMEGLASRLAASKLDADLTARLQRLLQDGETAVRRGDIFAHASIDLEFHRLIRERAGNRRLIRALDNLQNQIRVVLRTSASIPGRMPKAIDEHWRILAALQAGNPDLVEAATRDHVSRIREAVLRFMRVADADGQSTGNPI